MSVIRDIIYGAVQYGADANSICAVAGIAVDDLNKQELKATFTQGHLVWQEAVKQTNDELLGLHIGANTTTSIVGLVGHLMQSSSTLAQAFENLSQYTAIITDMFSYKSVIDSETFCLYLEPSAYWQEHFPQTAKQATEQAIAGAINVCKLLTGRNLIAKRVELTIQKPDNSAEYERVLNTALVFNKKHNRVVFDASVANLPILGYNKDLLTLFKKLSEEALQKVNTQPTFTNNLKKTITGQFYNRIPQLEEVAAYMNIAPRTLQRRLQQEDTSFQKISDEFKQELAIRLLSLNKYTVNETAYMLGYTEPAEFRRAFKRWTGKTPKTVR
jgi:AraC-like DNA-binding protein